MITSAIAVGKLKRGRRLYRLFDELQYAQDMIQGSLRFGSLARYRDLEEQRVRGDRREGTSVYAPPKGLEITNYARNTYSVQQGWRMESDVKADEIFVFCMSKSLTEEMTREFNAVACVDLSLTRFRGHFPKGGYDVHDGSRSTTRSPTATAVQ